MKQLCMLLSLLCAAYVIGESPADSYKQEYNDAYYDEDSYKTDSNDDYKTNSQQKTAGGTDQLQSKMGGGQMQNMVAGGQLQSLLSGNHLQKMMSGLGSMFGNLPGLGGGKQTSSTDYENANNAVSGGMDDDLGGMDGGLGGGLEGKQGALGGLGSLFGGVKTGIKAFGDKLGSLFGQKTGKLTTGRKRKHKKKSIFDDIKKNQKKRNLKYMDKYIKTIHKELHDYPTKYHKIFKDQALTSSWYKTVDSISDQLKTALDQVKGAPDNWTPCSTNVTLLKQEPDQKRGQSCSMLKGTLKMDVLGDNWDITERRVCTVHIVMPKGLMGNMLTFDVKADRHMCRYKSQDKGKASEKKTLVYDCGGKPAEKVHIKEIIPSLLIHNKVCRVEVYGH